MLELQVNSSFLYLRKVISIAYANYFRKSIEKTCISSALLFCFIFCKQHSSKTIEIEYAFVYFTQRFLKKKQLFLM